MLGSGKMKGVSSRGGLNLESALVIALLVLTASFTLFSLGDAIRCLYQKEASMASRIGFWAAAPNAVPGAGFTGGVSWETAGNPEGSEYTILRMRPGDGADPEDHSTWADLGTYTDNGPGDTDPVAGTVTIAGLDVTAGDTVAIAVDVERCGYRLIGPQWPADGDEVPAGAWYFGSFLAADDGAGTNPRWYVAAFGDDGSQAWHMPAGLEPGPAEPGRVGVSANEAYVRMAIAGDPLDLGAVYAIPGWTGTGHGEPREIVGPSAFYEGSPSDRGDDAVYALDLDSFHVSGDGLQMLVAGTRDTDGAGRMLLVDLTTRWVTDTGVEAAPGSTGVFARGTAGRAYALDADRTLWRLRGASEGGNAEVATDIPAGYVLESADALGNCFLYSEAGQGILRVSPGGEISALGESDAAGNASVAAATREGGLPVMVDGTDGDGANALHLASDGSEIDGRLLETAAGPYVGYLSFASVQGPSVDLGDPPTPTGGDPAWPVVPSAGPGGTISPDATQLVPDGGSASFTMAPDPGYHVEDVLVDGVSVGDPPSYDFASVTAPHAIHVEFSDGVTPAGASHTVTPSAGPGGSISPAVPVTLPAGSDAAFAMAPDPGYRIASVSVDGGASVGTPPSYVFEGLSADHSIRVEFEAAPTKEPDSGEFTYEILVNGTVVHSETFTPADPDSVTLNDIVPGTERDRYATVADGGATWVMPWMRAATSRTLTADASVDSNSQYAEINAPGGLSNALSSMASPWSNAGDVIDPNAAISYWGRLTPGGEALSPGWALLGAHADTGGQWAQTIEHGQGHATAIGRDGNALADSLCISVVPSREHDALELGGHAYRTYTMAGGAAIAAGGETDPNALLQIYYPMRATGTGFRTPDTYLGTSVADMALEIAGVSWDGGTGRIPDSYLGYFNALSGYPGVSGTNRGALMMDTGTAGDPSDDTVLSYATRIRGSHVEVRVTGGTVHPVTYPAGSVEAPEVWPAGTTLTWWMNSDRVASLARRDREETTFLRWYYNAIHQGSPPMIMHLEVSDPSQDSGWRPLAAPQPISPDDAWGSEIDRLTFSVPGTLPAGSSLRVWVSDRDMNIWQPDAAGASLTTGSSTPVSWSNYHVKPFPGNPLWITEQYPYDLSWTSIRVTVLTQHGFMDNRGCYLNAGTRDSTGLATKMELLGVSGPSVDLTPPPNDPPTATIDIASLYADCVAFSASPSDPEGDRTYVKYLLSTSPSPPDQATWDSSEARPLTGTVLKTGLSPQSDYFIHVLVRDDIHYYLSEGATVLTVPFNTGDTDSTYLSGTTVAVSRVPNASAPTVTLSTTAVSAIGADVSLWYCISDSPTPPSLPVNTTNWIRATWVDGYETSYSHPSPWVFASSRSSTVPYTGSLQWDADYYVHIMPATSADASNAIVTVPFRTPPDAQATLSGTTVVVSHPQNASSPYVSVSTTVTDADGDTVSWAIAITTSPTPPSTAYNSADWYDSTTYYASPKAFTDSRSSTVPSYQSLQWDADYYVHIMPLSNNDRSNAIVTVPFRTPAENSPTLSGVTVSVTHPINARKPNIDIAATVNDADGDSVHWAYAVSTSPTPPAAPASVGSTVWYYYTSWVSPPRALTRTAITTIYPQGTPDLAWDTDYYVHIMPVAPNSMSSPVTTVLVHTPADTPASISGLTTAVSKPVDSTTATLVMSGTTTDADGDSVKLAWCVTTSPTAPAGPGTVAPWTSFSGSSWQLNPYTLTNRTVSSTLSPDTDYYLHLMPMSANDTDNTAITTPFHTPADVPPTVSGVTVTPGHTANTYPSLTMNATTADANGDRVKLAYYVSSSPTPPAGPGTVAPWTSASGTTWQANPYTLTNRSLPSSSLAYGTGYYLHLMPMSYTDGDNAVTTVPFTTPTDNPPAMSGTATTVTSTSVTLATTLTDAEGDSVRLYYCVTASPTPPAGPGSASPWLCYGNTHYATPRTFPAFTAASGLTPDTDYWVHVMPSAYDDIDNPVTSIPVHTSP